MVLIIAIFNNLNFYDKSLLFSAFFQDFKIYFFLIPSAYSAKFFVILILSFIFRNVE